MGLPDIGMALPISGIDLTWTGIVLSFGDTGLREKAVVGNESNMWVSGAR